MVTAVFRAALRRSSRVTRSRQALVALPRHVRSPILQKYRSKIRAVLTRDFFPDRQTAIISRTRSSCVPICGFDHALNGTDSLGQCPVVVEGVDENVPKCLVRFGISVIQS